MPDEETLKRAEEDKAAGKAPTTQAGELVREEIEHVRSGKHGARSTKQAIAIGLSKARRAGIELPPPPESAQETTKESAASAERAAEEHREPSPQRSRATSEALEREGQGAASSEALAEQARGAARRRSPSSRSAAARKAAHTKGAKGRKAAAKKAAKTRAHKR